MGLPVSLNGQLLGEEEAAISVRDHGLVVGDGAFETVLVTNGRPFALRRHIDRLLTSAAGLGIAGVERRLVEEAVRQVTDAAVLERGRLRLTVTSGPGPFGSARGGGAPTVLAALEPEPAAGAAASVVVAPWTRNEKGALCGLKTTSYAENVRALTFATDQGATEAIFANTGGLLCEGTGSNVFLVLEGTLVTPTLASGCLAGVTRALVLEHVGAEERDVPLEALSPERASEAFLTSTVRGVQPIRDLDGVAFPDERPVTAAVAAAYACLLAAGGDP